MDLVGAVAALVLSAFVARDARVFAQSAVALKAARASTIGRGRASTGGTGTSCVLAARGETALAAAGVTHLARLGCEATIIVPTDELHYAFTTREPHAFVAAPFQGKRDLVQWYRRTHPHHGFWLFDSDSRPLRVPPPADPTRFQQMGSIYWSKDAMMSGLAFLQTCVSLGEELPRIRRGRCFYLVGHGLYVPPQPSQSFPVGLTDDVALGYLLSRAGEAAYVTSAEDGCDVARAPVSLREHIRQAQRWMGGDYAATRFLAWPCRLRRRVELHATWTHRLVTVASLLALSIRTAGKATVTILFAAWSLRFVCRLFAIRHYVRLVSPLTGPSHHPAKFAVGVAIKPGLDAIAWIAARGALRERTTDATWMPSLKDEACRD
jgi:hypothetical protein